ncbi:MAG: hypothetical protein ACKPKO_32030, partial [Candidatus Fonsibacter sp.]
YIYIYDRLQTYGFEFPKGLSEILDNTFLSKVHSTGVNLMPGLQRNHDKHTKAINAIDFNKLIYNHKHLVNITNDQNVVAL